MVHEYERKRVLSLDEALALSYQAALATTRKYEPIDLKSGCEMLSNDAGQASAQNKIHEQFSFLRILMSPELV